MSRNKDESNLSVGGSMSKVTERLLAGAAILVMAYVLWNLSVNTVVALVKRNVQITQLNQRLVHCQATLKDLVRTPKAPIKK